ncbi:unnamed protein product [Arctogadus glacialis]
MSSGLPGGGGARAVLSVRKAPRHPARDAVPFVFTAHTTRHSGITRTSCASLYRSCQRAGGGGWSTTVTAATMGGLHEAEAAEAAGRGSRDRRRGPGRVVAHLKKA